MITHTVSFQMSQQHLLLLCEYTRYMRGCVALSSHVHGCTWDDDAHTHVYSYDTFLVRYPMTKRAVRFQMSQQDGLKGTADSSES